MVRVHEKIIRFNKSSDFELEWKRLPLHQHWPETPVGSSFYSENWKIKKFMLQSRQYWDEAGPFAPLHFYDTRFPAASGPKHSLKPRVIGEKCVKWSLKIRKFLPKISLFERVSKKSGVPLIRSDYCYLPEHQQARQKFLIGPSSKIPYLIMNLNLVSVTAQIPQNIGDRK